MKKSVIVSSVAAFAIAGMLAFTGCGGNSGKKNSSNPNVFDGGKVSVQPSLKKNSSIDEKGSTGKIKVAVKVTNPKGETADKNPITIQLKNVSGTNKKGDDCKQVAGTSDACKVEVQESCNNTVVDGRKGSTKAFTVLTDAGESIYHGSKEYRYGGTLNIFTDDDIDSCTLYVAVDFDCILGSDGRGVYVNDDTAPEGSKVLVVLTDKDGNVLKDADGNPVKKEGTLKYRDHTPGHTPSGAYVSFEDSDGIPLGGHGLGDIGGAYFYIDMNTNVPDSHDVWSGATGGSGATGAGG
jgi:hypothetical protein